MVQLHFALFKSYVSGALDLKAVSVSADSVLLGSAVTWEAKVDIDITEPLFISKSFNMFFNCTS